MFCEKLLVSSTDPQSFCLIENKDYPHYDTTLDKIIPDFFKNPELSAHIAVVCGGNEVWSAEEFRNALVAARQNEDVTSFSIEVPLESITDKTTYSSLINNDDGSPEELSGNSMVRVGEILEAIGDKLNSSSSAVQKALNKAVARLESMGEDWKDVASHIAFDERRAKSITELLDGLRKSNSFPSVMILIYLPVDAFNFFNDTNHNFPKQIEYVLRAENTRAFIQELKDKLSTREKELDTLEAEVARLKKEASQKDSELSEKNAMIKSLKAEIANLKAQIQQLHLAVARGLQGGISAIVQMVGSFPLEYAYIYEDFNLAFENLSTPQLEKFLSFLNQVLEDRTQDDPNYANFTQPPYNPAKPSEISNPVVETDESTVGATIVIEEADIKDSLEPDDPQRTKENLNRSHTEYEESIY